MAVLISTAADSHDLGQRGVRDPSHAPWQNDPADGDLEAAYRSERDEDLPADPWEPTEDELS